MKEIVNEEAQFKALYEEYLTWKASQEGQQDAYEYERSFDEFCQQMNRSMLEIATQGKDTTGKKKSIPSLEE